MDANIPVWISGHLDDNYGIISFFQAPSKPVHIVFAKPSCSVKTPVTFRRYAEIIPNVLASNQNLKRMRFTYISFLLFSPLRKTTFLPQKADRKWFFSFSTLVLSCFWWLLSLSISLGIVHKTAVLISLKLQNNEAPANASASLRCVLSIP